jgi:DNA-binding transcriptional MerR regulator
MVTLPDVHLGSDESLYNIGVVSRMTGVSMATLRAWERRYNFPESERTSGGHRLYSENDVLQLRWVKERIDDGMQTAQAIHALHHQENVGNLTLVDQLPTSNISTTLKAGPHLRACEEQLRQALLSRDLAKADSVLGETLALSSPEDLILDVIGPALSNIGAAWEKGEISVATEHLATNYLRQRLLMWMVSGPPPRTTNPIMLACGPDEWHEGSLLILGALLRRRRWPVSYLGQSLPLPDLASFVKEINPLMVILIAMTEETAVKLAEWPHWLPKAAQNGRPIIGFGGRIFTLQPEWRMRVAGTYLVDTFREGLNNIEHLLIQAG